MEQAFYFSEIYECKKQAHFLSGNIVLRHKNFYYMNLGIHLVEPQKIRRHFVDRIFRNLLQNIAGVSSCTKQFLRLIYLRLKRERQNREF